ncbi:MAG: hypothetical protein ACR2NL_00380 [Acidimicrobiia bacterium]
MKVLLHPGGALFVMAGLAFVLRRLPVDRIPLIGGIAMTLLFIAMIFGFIGGIFLTLKVRQAEASA